MSKRMGFSRKRRAALRMSVALMLVAGLLMTGIQAALAQSIKASFELEGNAVDSPAGVPPDWSTLVAANTNGSYGAHFVAKTATPIVDGDSTTTPKDISYFKGGGSKDERDISGTGTVWAHSATDVAPDKDELMNAAAAAYRVPRAGNGNEDLVLYFSADRFSNSGDSALGFWFFKNEISLNANGTFNGVHGDGDLLLITDFSNGGTVGTVLLFRWNGATSSLQAVPTGSASPDCGTYGAGSDAIRCAIENDGGEASAWAYQPKTGANNIYASNTFIEGGINITRALASTNGGQAADECFAGFMAQTRSSTSTTAQLKDFVLDRFPVCAPSTTMTASPDVSTPAVIIKGGSQTFTFTETNDGDAPLTNVSVTTNNANCATPAPVLKTSGDTTKNIGDADDDAKLDKGETWTFRCTLTNIQADTTITATGHGTDLQGRDVTFCETGQVSNATRFCDQDERAQAKVVVVTPATSLTVSPVNPTVYSGSDVKYTFEEENTSTGGAAADRDISNPSLTTDSGSGCSPTAVLQTSGPDTGKNVGDLNGDGKLNFGEKWKFECTVQNVTANVNFFAYGHGTILGHDVTWCSGTPPAADPNANPPQFCSQTERAQVQAKVIAPATTLTMTANAAITYTITEDNEGNSPLDPVTPGSPFVSANNCSNLTLTGGDANSNQKIDPPETFTYTCTANLSGPTGDTGSTSVTNVAIGSGKDELGNNVTFCADPQNPGTGILCSQNERDRVTVTIQNHARGPN